MKNKTNIFDELIFKVLNKEGSESENEMLQEWINRSSGNKKIFLQIKKLWKDPKGVQTYTKIDQDRAWDIIHRKIAQRPVRKILQPALKVAAIVVIAYLLGALTMYFVRQKPQTQTDTKKEIYVKAPLGSKSELILSDGTKVWLNSGSEIHYPAVFGPNQRDIDLTGEAYFEVKKNKEAPFFVHTNKTDIRVLGTQFNVKSYPEDRYTETVLVEGSVNINKKGSNKTIQLKPNEKATLKKDGDPNAKFVIAKNINTELYTAWKNEKLIFKREKFGKVVVLMERWYNVQITVINKKVEEERVTGSFENESIEQALNALKISMPFTYQINKNKIIIRQ